MTSESSVSPAAWGFDLPTVPKLDAKLRASFFAEAPVETVIELNGDLLLRKHNGDWLHLEELVHTGGYSEYREHAVSTPEWLTNELSSEYSVIRVLRFGSNPIFD